jgi:hypothetical protein
MGLAAVVVEVVWQWSGRAGGSIMAAAKIWKEEQGGAAASFTIGNEEQRWRWSP